METHVGSCSFQFIDLAGSEKFEKQEMKSIGNTECKKINNSLFVLKKVIAFIAYNNTIQMQESVKLKEKPKELPKSGVKAMLLSSSNKSKDKQPRVVP